LAAWGFDNLDIDVIVSFVETGKVASIHVLDKCGFSHICLGECHYGMLERYEIYR
tara:strand:+ start:938 stop:1102 length:165 start_codon:yes stop_codon:yes gene_type:complete